jgi:hypothetical protein
MVAAHSISIAALLSATAGVALLRYGWRRPSRWRSLIVTGGWAAAAAAVVMYSAAFGIEVGPAHAALAFSIAGIASVLINIELRTPKRRAERARSIAPADAASSIGRAALRTVTAGVLTTFAAYEIGIAYAACVPARSSNLLVFGAFTVLVVWSALVVWAMSDPRVVRVALVLSLAALLAKALASWPMLCE